MFQSRAIGVLVLAGALLQWALFLALSAVLLWERSYPAWIRSSVGTTGSSLLADVWCR
jgi:hypothetical protein